jgi:putative cardiolipin synthase
VKHTELLLLFALILLQTACGTGGPVQQTTCTDSVENTIHCPPAHAVDDSEIDRIFEQRTWLSYGKLGIDPIELGKQVEIPVQNARAKIVGISQEDALNSLTAKLWMIENAEHTLDLVYYIYRDDVVGKAMLGALCDAVIRGVDVRFMVDSTGSIALPRAELRALASCSAQAGFINNARGIPTKRRARAQVVIFNPLTNLTSNANRRAHDKLIVKDGYFPSKSAVMVGGRNIAADYYGIDQNGERNEDTYRDSEILLRDHLLQHSDDQFVGENASIYFTLLFLFKDNYFITPKSTERAHAIYRRQRRENHQDWQDLENFPLIKTHMDAMDDYMNEGFHVSEVLLAHELANLTDRNVIYSAPTNISANPNSIVYILNELGDRRIAVNHIRFVSPYLFLAEYRDKEGTLQLDEAANLLQWLEENPEGTAEIVTNSIVTSDNFSAQSIIDMSTAPRVVLDPATREAWLKASEKDGLPELVKSDHWQQLVNNARVKIYQTGRSDSILLPGGSKHYGKMHAKFVVDTDIGFIGTTNFDYRSRLFNNEMGYFFRNAVLIEQLNAEFEMLKADSYLWGTPEWLEMRQQVNELKGIKGWSTRNQRSVYKTLNKLGLDWLF